MKRRIGWIAVSGAALTALAMGMPPASAQSAGIGGLTLRAANGTSTYQAGYFDNNPPSSASARAKFTVPALTCTSTDSGIALGSIMVVSGSQNYSTTAAYIVAECSGGSPAYFADVEVNGYPRAAKFTPAVGDLIKTSVSETANGGKAFVTDVTQSQIVGKAVAMGKNNDWVWDGIVGLDDNAGNLMPVPNFGTVKFKAATEEGQSVIAVGATAVDMKSSAGVLQIHTGATNTAGNEWKEIFKHS